MCYDWAQGRTIPYVVSIVIVREVTFCVASYGDSYGMVKPDTVRFLYMVVIFLWIFHEDTPWSKSGRSCIIVTVVLCVLSSYRWPRYIENLLYLFSGDMSFQRQLIVSSLNLEISRTEMQQHLICHIYIYIIYIYIYISTPTFSKCMCKAKNGTSLDSAFTV